MRSVGIVVLVVMLLLAGAQLVPAPDVRAQESDVCTQVVSTALSSAKEACGDLERGSVCYGSAGAAVVLAADQTGDFAAAGDVLALSALDLLTTAPADAETGQWGIAVLMLPASLPEGAEGSVRAVTFGDTQIGRPAAVADTDRPTITVTNSGNADVNLRNGAAISYTAVGKLAPGQSAVADGRNEQADWVRIQTDSGPAWVFTPLITWDGDVQTLDVLLPDDVTPSVTGGEPFQSLTLVTGPASEVCGSAPSGLLLQFTADQPATIQINGTTLASTDALLVVRSADDTMEIDVIAGTVTITARSIPQEASAGDGVEVDLDGLTPAAAPRAAGSYAFAQVANTPVELMAGSLPCVVGLDDVSAGITLRVGPGTNRGPLADMRADRSYTVLGWANDPDGAPWWQLDTGEEKSWAAQADVTTFGACDVVAQIDAPGLVTAAPAGSAGGDGGANTSTSSLAPTANTVWQMIPGSDNMTGQCSGAPAINFCDHLAAIAPIEGGISWKGMEASPYYLTQVQPNVYAYSGPNAMGTGTVNMTLSFTSTTSLSMTETLTLSNEPGCQHTYYYSGTKNW